MHRALKLREFLRVAKSDIIFIVGVSSLAGFLANPHFILKPMAVIPLLITGFLASASAAIFNNLYDYDLDLKMTRTRYRGEIIKDNRKQLALIATAMLAASVVIAYIAINAWASMFIFLGFFSYAVVYTIVLKRRTSWSIVIGGSAASFALLAGWVTIGDVVSINAMYLAALMFVWVPMHFWSFAVSHAKDYKDAGIPMLPAVLGEKGCALAIMASASVLLVIVLMLFVNHIIFGVLVYAVPIAAFSALLLYFNLIIVRSPAIGGAFKNLYRYSHIYISSVLAAVIVTNAIGVM